jgi:hypothetical protein
MYEILKPFFYFSDRYEAGDTKPVNDDLAPGLIGEGFIKDPEAKDPKPKKK